MGSDGPPLCLRQAACQTTVANPASLSFSSAEAECTSPPASDGSEAQVDEQAQANSGGEGTPTADESISSHRRLAAQNAKAIVRMMIRTRK